MFLWIILCTLITGSHAVPTEPQAQDTTVPPALGGNTWNLWIPLGSLHGTIPQFAPTSGQNQKQTKKGEEKCKTHKQDIYTLAL